MYNVIKKANNGWEVHKVAEFDTISLVKYCANHQDINKLIEILQLLYKDKVIEGTIDIKLAMQDEYLQNISIGDYQFIINLDFWETLSFYPKQKEGNSYAMNAFDKLAINTN